MKLQSASILLMLTVLLSCRASQNHSFIKSKSEKLVHLVGLNRPYVDFVLESGDTLKFSNHDVLLLLEKQSRNQIKSQGYLSNKSLRDISETLSGKNTDTIVYQNLSAVGNKTLSGTLDTWIARELLLEGKAIVAQNNQADNPKTLRYVFIKDNLGGQQGTFYAESGKKIYWTIIALGE